jgi:hypothetical protein
MENAMALCPELWVILVTEELSRKCTWYNTR